MEHQGTKLIHTARLLLRKFKLSDAEEMYNNWAKDPEVTKYLTWPHHDSIETTKKLLSIWEEEAELKNTYQWCIVEKDTNQAIGSIGVVHYNEIIEEAETGYCIGKKYWGAGYTTEALLGIIEYLFKEVNINRIIAKHDINNPASGKVMEKCGMRQEGILREAGRNNTGICDMVIRSILKSEWEGVK